MSIPHAERRADLKMRLIDATRKHIADGGLSAINARDITRDAKCALGGIYTVFADLDDLIIHANTVTLNQMHELMSQIGEEEGKPQAKLIRFTEGYLDFALQHRNLWLALFDHRVSSDYVIPQWHLDSLNRVFGHIMKPLSALLPQLDEQQLYMRARTIFAAVHGIITMSLQARYVSVPEQQLREELIGFVEDYLRTP